MGWGSGRDVSQDLPARAVWVVIKEPGQACCALCTQWVTF